MCLSQLVLPPGRAGRGHSSRGQCLQCRIPGLCGQNLQTRRCFCARISWHRALPWGRCSVPRGGTGRPGPALALLCSCWEFIFWAVCSLLWQFLSVETSLGVFPFLVWFGLKLQQKVRTETTARGSECFTMSTTSESGFLEELNSLPFPVLKIPHQVVTGDCWLVWAGLNTP